MVKVWIVKKIKIRIWGWKNWKSLDFSKIKDFDFFFKGKKRLFWIYGPINTCITFLLNQFFKKIGQEYLYGLPGSMEDFVSYAGKPFLYIDEFKGNYLIEFLIKLCDDGFQVNIKGRSTFVSKKKCVIIISNYNPFSCYNKIEKILFVH